MWGTPGRHSARSGGLPAANTHPVLSSAWCGRPVLRQARDGASAWGRARRRGGHRLEAPIDLPLLKVSTLAERLRRRRAQKASAALRRATPDRCNRLLRPTLARRLSLRVRRAGWSLPANVVRGPETRRRRTGPTAGADQDRKRLSPEVGEGRGTQAPFLSWVVRPCCAAHARRRGSAAPRMHFACTTRHIGAMVNLGLDRAQRRPTHDDFSRVGMGSAPAFPG